MFLRVSTSMLLTLSFAIAVAQNGQLRPHSMYEPPAAAAAASLAASAQGVAPELLTFGEKDQLGEDRPVRRRRRAGAPL